MTKTLTPSQAHKIELKKAKADHKEAKKHIQRFKEAKDNIIRAFLNSELPNWGGLKFTP